MTKHLFRNVRVFDGEGTPPFPADVLVTGNRISAVAAAGALTDADASVIEGNGNTLMPGMTEAHAHVTYTDFVQLRELGDIPVEEHVLLTMENVRTMLDMGFTSLYSAASSKLRLEVVIRDAINSGRIAGPRMRAASPEITSTGGLGDVRQLHMHHEGIEVIVDGADDMRRTVRMLIREGVDTIKVNISGDNFVRQGFGRKCSYSEAEIAAAASEAHERGAWLSCHARADEAVRMALRHKFRVIYHCDFIEGETFDLLEAARDDIFLAPALGIIYTTAYEAEPWGITREVAEHMEMFRMLETAPGVYTELRQRGLRILPGGDYGFAWNPMGTNARDLEHFVKLLGFTPAEALSAATKLGGEIMGIEGLGLVKDGYLADLLLVNGDPVADVTILQNRDNLLAIMKDGQFHKHPAGETLAAFGGRSAVTSVWQTA